VKLREIFVNGPAASSLIPESLRYLVLRLGGYSVETSRIQCGLNIFGAGRLSIGRDTYINRQCLLNCSGDIVIGQRVYIGPRAMILTASHEIGAGTQRAGIGVVRRIHIGDGVWLGAGVTVLPGVSIGAGSIIGAGSVVLRDCDDHSIYAGNPARLVRRLSERP
jgi:acetyltransferase-like isoleucine patch superfamily enzyme